MSAKISGKDDQLRDEHALYYDHVALEYRVDAQNEPAFCTLSSAVTPASVFWLLLGDFVATSTQHVSPRSRQRGLL